MFIFSRAKSFGLSYSISIVPPCGNMYSTHLRWKLLAPLHVLVLLLAYACICCVPYLPILSFQVCVCWLHSMYMCCVLSLHWILFYLIWLLWEINGSFHFGGVTCFVHFTILKMCVHEVPLSVDILWLSSLYEVCHAHEKFKFYNIH